MLPITSAFSYLQQHGPQFNFYEGIVNNCKSLKHSWSSSTEINFEIWIHFSDVIMGTMASQITSLTVVYSTVCSGADQRNIKAPRHWPLWGHKEPVTRKMLPFDKVIMRKSQNFAIIWARVLSIWIKKHRKFLSQWHHLSLMRTQFSISNSVPAQIKADLAQGMHLVGGANHYAGTNDLAPGTVVFHLSRIRLLRLCHHFSDTHLVSHCFICPYSFRWSIFTVKYWYHFITWHFSKLRDIDKTKPHPTLRLK